MEMSPSSSMSRAVNSFARQADAYAPSTETAKQSFKNKLTALNGLTPAERNCLQGLAEAIFDGELCRLQEAVTELGKQPRRSELNSVLAQELRCPGIVLLPLQLAKWRFELHEDCVDIAIFAVQLIRARRILALANDKRFQAHVYGPERDEDMATSGKLNEDPRILLKQIGRITTCGAIATPPPFYTGG